MEPPGKLSANGANDRKRTTSKACMVLVDELVAQREVLFKRDLETAGSTERDKVGDVRIQNLLVR